MEFGYFTLSDNYYDAVPLAAVIACTADPKKVDGKTRSKWSRVLRYAAEKTCNATFGSVKAG